MDALARLQPPLRVGERVSLRVSGPVRDLIGFVIDLDPLTLEDRHGIEHPVGASAVLAARRVPVSLGRDPTAAPAELLDELAARAELATGLVSRIRISDLLAGRPAPADVFPERGSWADGRLRARVEGEWLTTNVSDPPLLEALAWWATRQNARSIQIRG